MLRVTIICLVTIIGLTTGLLVGLIGGAALIEFGKSSCTGAGCGGMIVRSILPVAAILGAILGFAKGLNLTSGANAKLIR